MPLTGLGRSASVSAETLAHAAALGTACSAS